MTSTKKTSADKNSLRQQNIAKLRELWQETLNDKTPVVPADDVLNRIERKYQALVKAMNTAK